VSLRFKPDVEPIDPYGHTEFGVMWSRRYSTSNLQAFCPPNRKWAFIRRRIRKRSDLQTGSWRCRTDFRSVPKMGLVALPVCSRSQFAGSNHFRDIAFLVIDFLSLPAKVLYSTIAESHCASRMTELLNINCSQCSKHLYKVCSTNVKLYKFCVKYCLSVY